MSEKASSEVTGRVCVFCKQPANSREHLFSDWLSSVLPAEDRSLHFRKIGRGGDHHERTRRPFREKTRVVCRECNNGWMSDVEEAGRAILELPIRRQPVKLSSEAQTIAATWAFKTCLVFQASQMPEAIAPPGHFGHLYLNGLPPSTVHMWISSNYRADRDPANSVYVQRPMALEPLDEKLKQDDEFGYLSFLAIGGVSFLVLGSRYGNHTEVTYHGSVAEALIKLWPVASPVIAWPPPYMMDRDFIDILTLPPSGFTARISPGRSPSPKPTT